jgi:hypothetical protein
MRGYFRLLLARGLDLDLERDFGGGFAVFLAAGFRLFLAGPVKVRWTCSQAARLRC